MDGEVSSLRAFTHGMRQHGAALLAGAAQPHEELLALVWGPRFDREHALGLVMRQRYGAGDLLAAMLEWAQRFDALPSASQRRLRQLIVRHRARSQPGGQAMGQ